MDADAPGDAPTPARGYRYRGDVAIADVAFEAWGSTLGELFAAAADATVNTMVEDLATIEGRQRREISVEEESVDLLLFRFLEDLVYLKDAEGLLLRVPAVRILRREGGLRLEAEAAGEPIDPRRHRLQSDVKAVTMHRLAVQRQGGGWHAFVVLDI